MQSRGSQQGFGDSRSTSHAYAVTKPLEKLIYDKILWGNYQKANADAIQ